MIYKLTLENDYEKDIQCLVNVIDIVFETLIKREIEKLIYSYKDDFLKNNNTSVSEFNDMIETNAMTIKDSLSKKYLNMLINKYFSINGFTLYVISSLTIKSREFIRGTSFE